MPYRRTGGSFGRKGRKMRTDYVVLDLEMTGLNPKTDRILEAGAVRVRDGKVTDTFSRLINPGRKLTEKVTEITGITNEMAEQGADPETAMQEFFAFLGDDILVGQNLIFDYSFLKQWAVNHKTAFERSAIDTLKIARKCLPPEEKKDLESLCHYFGIERRIGHRACEDAAQTQKVLECLWERYGEVQPEIFKPYPLQYKAKKQTPATKQQFLYLQKFAAYHKIEFPEVPQDISRSEMSRLTDRLIAEYGKINS